MNNGKLRSHLQFQIQYFAGQISPINANINEVSEVEDPMSLFQNLTLNSSKLKIFCQTLKVVGFAIADEVVLNYTNTKLLKAHM